MTKTKNSNNQNQNSDLDENRSREYIDPNNSYKWKTNKKVIEKEWLEQMKFVLVMLQYLNDSLKEKEAAVGWWIIMITSFNSFLTLFDLEKLGTSTYFNINYDWTKSVTLSLLSIITTLLASWVKKKGFVKRIKELDKRIFSLEALCSKVRSELYLPIEDRPQYIEFYKKYINEVQDLLCYNQLISPTEMNLVMYNLTKNYPTLIKDIYPWYKKNFSGKYEPDYKFGRNIIHSYEKNLLNSIIYKVLSLFYCKSRCCIEIDDGNPFTKKEKTVYKCCKKYTPDQEVNVIRENTSQESQVRENIELEISDNLDRDNLDRDNLDRSNIDSAINDYNNFLDISNTINNNTNNIFNSNDKPIIIDS